MMKSWLAWNNFCSPGKLGKRRVFSEISSEPVIVVMHNALVDCGGDGDGWRDSGSRGLSCVCTAWQEKPLQVRLCACMCTSYREGSSWCVGGKINILGNSCDLTGQEIFQKRVTHPLHGSDKHIQNFSSAPRLIVDERQQQITVPRTAREALSPQKYTFVL